MHFRTTSPPSPGGGLVPARPFTADPSHVEYRSASPSRVASERVASERSQGAKPQSALAVLAAAAGEDAEDSTPGESVSVNGEGGIRNSAAEQPGVEAVDVVAEEGFGVETFPEVVVEQGHDGDHVHIRTESPAQIGKRRKEEEERTILHVLEHHRAKAQDLGTGTVVDKARKSHRVCISHSVVRSAAGEV